MAVSRKFVIRCRAVILHEGKLLVVRHVRDTSFVALPGGHLEWGEEVIECMRRELLEELGVEPRIGRLLYINTFIDTGQVQPIEFFFEIKNGKDYLFIDEKVRTHAHELAEILWISPSDDIKVLPEALSKDFKNGEIISGSTKFIRN